MNLLAPVRTARRERIADCSIPAFREWYTSLRRYPWPRGGARSSFAAEIVLCTIRGTPHSHLPLKCERPRLYLLILLAPYRSRTRPETKRNPKTESVKYGGTISRTIISRRRSGPTPARRAVAPPPAAAAAVGGLGYTLGPARGRPFNWSASGVCGTFHDSVPKQV